MKQHENDLNPGPLSVSGYKMGSCYRANLPDNNRMHFKPTAKGHRWFRRQSGYRFYALNHSLTENPFRLSPKRRLNEFAVNPGEINLNPEIIFPGCSDCLVATNFRTHTSDPLTNPARAVRTDLPTSLIFSSLTMEIAVVYPGINITPVCRTVDDPVDPNRGQLLFGHSRGKFSFRWRKNKPLACMVASVTCPNRPGEFRKNKATD